MQSVGRKKGCDVHRKSNPSQELETKRKACRQVRYPKLSLSNSVCLSADGNSGRGDVEGWECNCVVKKELVSFVYCTQLSNKESA